MKTLISILLTISAAVLCAGNQPEFITHIQKHIERNILAWKIASITPLPQSVKAPFAENGWRMILQRPLESRKKDVLTNVVRPGDPRNTAELIFLTGNPDIKSIRSKLTWLKEPGELSTTVVYLGKKMQYDIFVRADIATISVLQKFLNSQGGDDLYPIYAKALNIMDFNDTSRKAAVQLLPFGGKRVIPLVNRAIGTAIAQDIDTSPHFVVLKKIGTPEVAAAFLNAYRSKYPNVLKSVEEALLIPPALKGCEQIYFRMLQQRKWIERVTFALNELGYQKKMLPLLNYLKREPNSFGEYMKLVFSEYYIKTGKDNIPEMELAEQIRLMLARMGDIPGAPKFISVTDKKKTQEADKILAERKRLEPLERQFIKTQNTENAICSALMLCLFKPTSQTFNKDYVARVNAEGLRLLRMLPRTKVRSVLRLLRDNVEDSQESEFFRKLMIQVGG